MRQNIATTEVQQVDWDLHYDGYGSLRDANDSEVWGCPDCGRLWTGIQQAHCAACHNHFSSDSAFDKHLGAVPEVGRPRCKGPTESKLVSRGDKYGLVWGRPGDRPALVQ